MNELMSLLAFGVFAILWIAFGYALVASQGSLDQTDEWLRGLPLIAQAVVAFLTLPVVIGLWVWETNFVSIAAVMGARERTAWTTRRPGDLVAELG
jgi:hypothetical protein